MEWISLSNAEVEDTENKGIRNAQHRLIRRLRMRKLCVINHRYRESEATRIREEFILKRKTAIGLHLAMVSYRHKTWFLKKEFREKSLSPIDLQGPSFGYFIKDNIEECFPNSARKTGTSSDQEDERPTEQDKSHKSQKVECRKQEIGDNVEGVLEGRSWIVFSISYPKKRKKLNREILEKLERRNNKNNDASDSISKKDELDKKMNQAKKRKREYDKNARRKLKRHIDHIQKVSNRFTRSYSWRYKLNGCSREFRVEDIGTRVKNQNKRAMNKIMNLYKLRRDMNDGKLHIITNTSMKTENDTFGINVLPIHNQLYDSLEMRMKRALLRRKLQLKYRTIRAHSLTLPGRFKGYEARPSSPLCFLNVQISEASEGVRHLEAKEETSRPRSGTGALTELESHQEGETSYSTKRDFNNSKIHSPKMNSTSPNSKRIISVSRRSETIRSPKSVLK